MPGPGRVAAVAGAAIVLAGLSVAIGEPASAGTTKVPRGFRATSITWISPTQGWVLGAAPCGDRTCSYVLGTHDSGGTWQRVGRIGSPIAHIGLPEQPGVTEIRFATARVGFAFAPRLLRTTDGGHSWSVVPIPGDGRQILDLAGNHTTAFALVSPCGWQRFQGCAGQLTLWRTHKLTGGRWSRIPLKLPLGTRGDVAVSGPTVYVVDPQEDLTGKRDVFYASTDGGRQFTSRPVPCDRPATPDVPLVQAVPTSTTDVALLCVGNPGFSKAEKSVYTSTDTAEHDHYAGRMGAFGYQSQLAASPSGNLAVASQSDGSFIYLNNTRGGRAWTTVWATSDGGAGWNDIAYLTDRVAWVVRGPLAGPGFSGRGRLYVTRDAGRHWYLHPIRSRT